MIKSLKRVILSTLLDGMPMASGASGEVVRCPNCNEDVPKTLYCLNCGYPLYKEETKKENQTATEEKIKPIKTFDEEETVIMVDDEKPTENAEEQPIITPSELNKSNSAESLTNTQPTSSDEGKINENIITKEQTEKVEPKEEIKTEEPIKVIPQTAVITEVSVNEPKQIVQEENSKQTAEKLTPVELVKSPEPISEPVSKITDVEKAEVTELIEDFPVTKTYVPDPLTKDLVDKIAKNIEQKLKLINLYREGSIKEDTFSKFFLNYVKEGKVWMSRREELIKDLSAEVEETEESYKFITEQLELLEIKKTIGEASEDEYSAKVPAYKWDIDHFDSLIGEKKNKISYLENLSSVMTNDEQNEYRELASTQYNTLDALQISDNELLKIIKDNIYEAIKILG